ncbi:hypothetical protein EVAR_16395_1 [Eumeta japonica]|uniref:Uncharacterized protein n=1 Tax=Eumeta variegata TaxID=151549 RepID=A0A4C1VVR8_EUMVA|nr:hypothetical protein EVAR_16395_1 [Eumeta japonica]
MFSPPVPAVITALTIRVVSNPRLAARQLVTMERWDETEFEEKNRKAMMDVDALARRASELEDVKCRHIAPMCKFSIRVISRAH